MLEWLTLTALLLVATVVLNQSVDQWQPSRLLYDRWIASDARAANPAIVIVAIDNASLARIGRWPWPRSVHAALLARLARTQARAVGLDVILAEADRQHPADDLALARAIRDNGRVVLPMYATHGRPVLPTPAFSAAAAAIGHIDLELDSDGVARSVFLREGTPHAQWDHLAVAMLRVAGMPQGLPPLPGERRPGAALPSSTAPDAPLWLRDNWIHIPFTGAPGHYTEVSYADVLDGTVPRSFFNGKLVLVGATAAGLGDSYPTPVSGHSRAMAGVEIIANVLDALIAHRAIVDAPPVAGLVLAIGAILLAMLGHFILTPRKSLALTVALAVATLMLSYLMLTREGLWIAPLPTVFMLVVAYPLWSWRRLEAVIRYLGQEFTRLDSEPHLLPERKAPAPLISDTVERQIHVMHQAVKRVRAMRRFIQDGVDSMPDATLICGPDQNVLLANHEALRYFGARGATQLRGTPLHDLLSHLRQPAHSDWSTHLQRAVGHAQPVTVEAQDGDGRDFLVKLVALFDPSHQPIGWIVTLIDISLIREAQRQRDETMRFLSHDIRSPQSSILALLENQKYRESALSPEVFAQRIGKYAERTLSLADDFVQLTRAESQAYQFEEVDLAQLLLDALDDVWELASARRIAIDTDLPEDGAPARGDRALLTRALINLLNNAIKYSDPDARVVCRIAPAPDGWCLSIHDQGWGIPADALPRLFEKFARFVAPGENDPGGTGLGLAFVKTVVDKHGGRLSVSSTVGQGSSFVVDLPASAS
ncbi:CHASE2 domain-containing protein [Pandoraea sp.]|uniref:CHASE2 domain-containing protein n=1 Tax=Pandoraea sp. TaxID=1883445 RepID=UPI0025F9B11B|nr:CHASE2 domain-containing protein [Pandoraea sp.]